MPRARPQAPVLAAGEPPAEPIRIDPGLPRAQRRRMLLDRDGARRVWCRRALSADGRELTTEHLVPRLKGGPSWPENELAACRGCNRRRGHLAPAAWIQRCRDEGQDPDVELARRSLERLAAAIERRGGQRRARPYLAKQRVLVGRL